MPTDGTPEPAGPAAPDDAVARAMAELRTEHPPENGERADRYWLRMGVGLGLRQPGRAALLLAGLEGGSTSSGPARRESAADEAVNGAGAVDANPATAADPAPASTPDVDPGTAAVGPADPNEVPVRSLLLARASVLSPSTDPETVFGWVGRLSPDEIRRLGFVVTQMLADGSTRDLERGFGLAWSAGTRLPREDLRRLFGRFGELELAVCGVLGGRDLLSIHPPESSAGVLVSMFTRRSSPANTEAMAILEHEGEPARRGLVAIWNAWVAMRYRDLIAPPLFEQLVQPWVGVVGRLPDR
jgi:hypothetical protein